MKRGLGVLLGLYAIYAAVAVWIHPGFIYPFTQETFQIEGYVQQQFVTDLGQIDVVETPGREGAPAVLFFMGNTGALARFPSGLSLHRDAGRHTVALAYPGGGGLPGRPAEHDLKARALAAYDWFDARTDQPIAVHGFSMGTGLALHVAAHRGVKTVILDAPFFRMCEQMSRMAILPACLLPAVQKWDNAGYVGALMADVMIQQGIEDQLVLPDDSRRLVRLMTDAGLDVTYHLVPGATHNNLFRRPGYGQRVADFLNR